MPWLFQDINTMYLRIKKLCIFKPLSDKTIKNKSNLSNRSETVYVHSAGCLVYTHKYIISCLKHGQNRILILHLLWYWISLWQDETNGFTWLGCSTHFLQESFVYGPLQHTYVKIWSQTKVVIWMLSWGKSHKLVSLRLRTDSCLCDHLERKSHMGSRL